VEERSAHSTGLVQRAGISMLASREVKDAWKLG
jgi:hypothetical protein